MRVVGIASSCDGCGKTMLARHIAVRTTLKTAVLPFAGALKRELWAVLETDAISNGLSSSHISPALTEKPTPIWARLLMRDWGDYKRKLDPDYWVKQWEQQIQETPDIELVIADDVRYRNEADAIHLHGGTVIFLDDVGTRDNQMLHELVDVRSMADIGFTVNHAGEWADPDVVVEALGL